ncbi:MAG: NADPH:quinone reductase [Erythrobacter sp.]
MKAAWYEQTGEAQSVIQIGERETPDLNSGELLVRIHASGVNPSDVKTRAGARGPIPFEFAIPHSDGAGVVEAVGEGVDSARIGQRVWLWNGAWRRQFGTCAELIALPAQQAVRLPEKTDFDAGACLGIPASTACYGVFSGGSIEGKTVLVTGGAGAVGYYAIQLAKWGGAKVISTVSSLEKAEVAKTAGADEVVNYRAKSAPEDLLDAANGKTVDRIVEVEFGGNLDLSNAVLAPEGVIATYGSMADPNPQLPFYDMMFNGTKLDMFLIYLLQSEKRDMVCETLNKALEEDALHHMIARRYSLAETAEAHLEVEAGATIGNIVIQL